MGESNARVPLAGGTGEPTGGAAAGNYGYFEMRQAVTLNQNGTNPVSATLYIPYAAPQWYGQIDSIVVDSLTSFNSATSAVLSVGKTAGGTQYASGVDVHAGATRQVVLPTAAQALQWQNIGQNSIVITITPTGATTAGQVTVYVYYVVGAALQPVITS